MKLALLAILLILPMGMIPAFAQYSYTQASIPIPSQLQGLGNIANQSINQVTGAKSITDSIISGLQSIINTIIGNANINPNTNPAGLSSDKLKTVSNSGFTVARDLSTTTWDFNTFIFNLINLSPFQIPFWIVVGIAGILTLIFLIKIGKLVFMKGVIIIGVILVGILLLMVIGIHNSVVT